MKEEGTLRLWTGGSHSLPYAVKWRLGHQAGLDGQEWSELYKDGSPDRSVGALTRA